MVGLASMSGLIATLPAAVIIGVDMDSITPGVQSSRTASPGDLFTATLFMIADASGVSSYSISVKFDTGELNLDPGAGASTEFLPPGFTFNFSPGFATESNATGDVASFDAATLGAGPTSTMFDIGTIKFKVITPLTDALADVTPGFFTAGIDGASDNSGASPAPTFLPGSVNVVPEPASGALILGGMTVLSLARRKRTA